MVRGWENVSPRVLAAIKPACCRIPTWNTTGLQATKLQECRTARTTWTTNYMTARTTWTTGFQLARTTWTTGFQLDSLCFAAWWPLRGRRIYIYIYICYIYIYTYMSVCCKYIEKNMYICYIYQYIYIYIYVYIYMYY